MNELKASCPFYGGPVAYRCYQISYDEWWYKSAKRFKKERDELQAELVQARAELDQVHQSTSQEIISLRTELMQARVKLNRMHLDMQDRSDKALGTKPTRPKVLPTESSIQPPPQRSQPCAAQRAERGEALAALVTEETAGLLERLAEWSERARGYAVGHWTAQDDQIGADAEVALTLAARIRKALDDSQA